MIADAQKDGPVTPTQELQRLLSRLSSSIREAEDLLHDLERDGAAERGEEAAAVARGLERRLEAAEGDRRELATRLVDAERRSERLMTLYVATYHLHSNHTPAGVEAAIAEIAVDLLGAHRFALLIRDESVEGCRVTLTRPPGLEPGQVDPMFAGGVYRGGDPMVDAALEDGVLRLAGEEGEPGSRALAAVPLNMERRTSGVLVILELLEQKKALTWEDRDILDLLAAHAASALLAAQLFAVKDRKLRTYRSLVKLAGGELAEEA